MCKSFKVESVTAKENEAKKIAQLNNYYSNFLFSENAVVAWKYRQYRPIIFKMSVLYEFAFVYLRNASFKCANYQSYQSLFARRCEQ